MPSFLTSHLTVTLADQPAFELDELCRACAKHGLPATPDQVVAWLVFAATRCIDSLTSDPDRLEAAFVQAFRMGIKGQGLDALFATPPAPPTEAPPPPPPAPKPKPKKKW